METAKVTIVGSTPFLMHADSIEWADIMKAWADHPDNKDKSKPGDDRTPPWRWIGCLNYDHPKTGIVTIPSEYIMRSIMGGAAQVLTGKGKATFKSLSQSGLICTDMHWPLLMAGKPTQMVKVQNCLSLKTFSENVEAAKSMGFSLFSKRAAIGKNKHIRVRPRFDAWSTAGTIEIIDDQISKANLQSFLDIAGRIKGLGDWRPGAKTPGPFGMFKATVQ